MNRASRAARHWHTLKTIVFRRDFAAWLWEQIFLDDIPGRAAQLSYYFLLALFPLLIFLTSLLGFVFARETGLEQRALGYLGSIMPRAAFDLVKQTIGDILRTSDGGKLSFGLLLSLWTASSGMEAIMEGLNVAFNATETRPWWKRRLRALMLTVTVPLLAGTAFAMILAGDAIARWFLKVTGADHVWQPVLQAAQFLTGASFLLLAIYLIYLFGPNLADRWKTQVIVPGAFVALVCWLAASTGLGYYLDHFSALGKTYGGLGAVIALLLWLYLTGATLLVGAEINTGIQSRITRP